MAAEPQSVVGQAVGAVLNGRWRLMRLIGEGGLAAVYEADGLAGQGRRAIKLLHPQFQTQRAVVERFYAEAQACYSLRHPHIAGVDEYAYAEDGSPYIVMELLEGQSLDDYLRSHPPMTPDMAAPLIVGVLQALSVAHAAGIVHRDLKPPNLFLVNDVNGRPLLKVLDFGIAKVMDLAGGLGSKTRTGALLGTPGYMSPEQIKNAKGVDPRSDLWSLGVVLYEMLTHQHPFGSDDQMARMVAILRDPSKPIAQVAPQLAGWEPFFQRALARDPAQRFQSAEEMAARLQELVGGARHPSQPPQTAAAAAVKGATMAMPALPAELLRRSDPPPMSPTPQSPHSSVPAQSMVPSSQLYGSGGPVVGTLSSESHFPKPVMFSGSTQVSGGRQGGVGYVPQINVETAAPLDPPSVVWWGVLLIGLGTFGAGLLLGYVLGSG
jgi:serine/threonine-protein kinase